MVKKILYFCTSAFILFLCSCASNTPPVTEELTSRQKFVRDFYVDLNGDAKIDMRDFYGLGTSNVIIIDEMITMK